METVPHPKLAALSNYREGVADLKKRLEECEKFLETGGKDPSWTGSPLDYLQGFLEVGDFVDRIRELRRQLG